MARIFLGYFLLRLQLTVVIRKIILPASLVFLMYLFVWYFLKKKKKEKISGEHWLEIKFDQRVFWHFLLLCENLFNNLISSFLVLFRYYFTQFREYDHYLLSQMISSTNLAKIPSSLTVQKRVIKITVHENWVMLVPTCVNLKTWEL